MQGLMLHKGAELVSREQLENLPTPAATITHQPVSHAGLVKLVERGLGIRQDGDDARSADDSIGD